MRLSLRGNRLPRFATATIALAISASAAAAPPAPRPILVELFTSQGCSSCPPADAVLRDLSTRTDVLPLAFHVDYWDYLGWKDTFSSPAYTQRQQAYSSINRFNVYTPQAVIDGRKALVGSNDSGVDAAIAAAKRNAGSAPATLTRSNDEVAMTVGTAEGTGPASGHVYLISFDAHDTTDIKRGENSGRSIVYANVVRSMREVGQWRNQPIKLDEKLRADERGDRLTLLVQDDNGFVWALASTASMNSGNATN